MSDRPLKASEIRTMSDEDRLKLLNELRMELVRLITQARSGTLTNVARIRIVRKNIARILTVINEERRRRV
ncbi:LSU ribosomal protein L29P [Ignisphaera aggregans DSM 17230]|uniref:Large ribosomal subunit protein uL29 n=1 Tax=Ignisphaera aggregans (strain DSM 17230 / JCM 13409 / AQ1.S1) TaxID=583356 RepID=E0SPY4_IGNAA|nr:LSU ribosomal protein L29P [Ignisphaera aggregans DSM 17230]